MTPVFRIEAGGTDVTERLRANLASIEFLDMDGTQSDEMTLRIAGDFARPAYGDELKLWLGYEESGLFFCGLFRVQTSERDGFGLRVSATGADFSASLKQKRDASYEKVALSDVAGIVAERHGLRLKSDFTDLYVTHLSQTDESDLHFMQRLATAYDGIFSVKNGTLIFLRRTKEAERSDALPSFRIHASECTDVRIRHANRTLYGACRAAWHDTKANAVRSVTVGGGEPVLRLEGQYKTAAEAKAKAEAALARANRGTKSGTIETTGREIYAGGTLRLEGFGEDDGEYSIRSVRHAFGDGWSVRVEIAN